MITSSYYRGCCLIAMTTITDDISAQLSVDNENSEIAQVEAKIRGSPLLLYSIAVIQDSYTASLLKLLLPSTWDELAWLEQLEVIDKELSWCLTSSLWKEDWAFQMKIDWRWLLFSSLLFLEVSERFKSQAFEAEEWGNPRRMLRLREERQRKRGLLKLSWHPLCFPSYFYWMKLRIQICLSDSAEVSLNECYYSRSIVLKDSVLDQLMSGSGHEGDRLTLWMVSESNRILLKCC